MSTPCTTCGEPLADDAFRCPTCGALASPTSEETGAGGAPPWSIPIREPADVPAREPRGGSARAVGLVALAVTVLVLAAAVGFRLLGDDGDPRTASRDVDAEDGAAPDSAGTGIGTVTTETTVTTQPTETTTTTAPTTTTVPTTTSTSASRGTTPGAPPPTTESAAPVGARTAPNGTGTVPALSTSFRGWVAQVKSVSYAAGTEALAEEWERTRTSVPGAVALRSNDWSGLGDGFWVLVDPGPFASAEDVRSFCTSAGLDDDACLARELRG